LGGKVGLVELFMILAFLVVSIVTTAFWIWMLVDCATKDQQERRSQITWIIIIALTHFIGAVVYFFVRRPKLVEPRKQQFPV
jgi:uncharacterized membrane protein